MEYVSKKVGGDDDFKTDTRTFLYIEMAADLTNNDAWILGKGANSRYYSAYFEQVNDGDSSNRLTSEVPFLLLLLRGGVLYTSLYLLFILLCIYKAVWKGNSSFLKCIGVMLAGWFANFFIGDVNGCSFFHLIFYSLCGLTLSEKWLNKTDSEINELINSKSIIRI